MSDLGEILDRAFTEAEEAEEQEEEGEVKETNLDSAPEPDKPEGPKIAAPEHWAPADKELFEAQDPDTQEWLLKKHKDMERDAGEKWQSAASLRKENEKLIAFAEETAEIVKPILTAYEQNGRKGQDGLREMAAWFQAVTNPNPEIRKKAAVQLIARMGIDPREAVEGDDIDDPQVAALKREVEQLKGYLQHSTTSAQQQTKARQQQELERAREEAAKEFGAFRGQKDDSGYLKHPHIEDQRVQKLMGGLLSSDPDLSLEDAYETAVKRFGLSEDSPAARIRKAKKAASGVRSKGDSAEDLSNLSVAEIASREWDRQVAGSN